MPRAYASGNKTSNPRITTAPTLIDMDGVRPSSGAAGWTIVDGVRPSSLRLKRMFPAGNKRRRIPKGFRLKAQAGEGRATLGKHCADVGSPNGVVAAFAAPPGHNPVGVADFSLTPTLGSSSLATTGWRTQ